MTQTIRAETIGRHSWLLVGDSRYPAEVFSEDIQLDSHCHRTRRARVKPESGWVVSVIWGSGTYSDNQDDLVTGEFSEEPCHVEVAVPWDGPWEPLSLVGAEVLNAILVQMATWPSQMAPPLWAQTGCYDRDPS